MNPKHSSRPPAARSPALRKCYWLDTPDARVMIGPWAVLIGRSPDCNVVLERPEVSRHHLLVRVGIEGAEMLPLGREPVLHNGVERRELTALRPGDRLGICGWEFRLGEAEVEDGTSSGDTAWCLERQSGLLHLVTGPSYRVGGGGDDDLIVEAWDPTVFSIALTADAPVLTALRPGLWCGRDLPPGESVTLAPDARITYRAETFHLRAKPAHLDVATRQSPRPKHAVVVVLEFLPRGAQLTVEIGGRLHVTMLSDRRSDLMACLLQPPPPYSAGEFIPEDTLCARVWPGENNGRPELNSLLYRLRQNLAEEGIDPAPLFERRGGGLRFCLAPRARVIVR